MRAHQNAWSAPLALWMLALAGTAPSLWSQDAADVVLHNGKILTLATDQGDFPVAEAVAVRSGRIQAVGTNPDILRLAGPQTKKVDLQGRAVMPGAWEARTAATISAIALTCGSGVGTRAE